MKDSAKKEGKRAASGSALTRIIIWSVVFCILSGLFVVGLMDSYTQSGWAWFDVFRSTSIRYDDRDYAIGGGTSKDAVTDLSVEWVAGSVTVVAAEGDELTITEDYTGDDGSMRLRWKIEDGQLSIKFCKPRRFGGMNAVKKNLTIAIPSVMLDAMGSVEIAGVDSDVSFTGNADELSLEAVDGDLAVTGDVGELELSAVDGTIVFRGGVRNGEVDCVNAHVTMYLDMATRISVDQVNGVVDLYLGDEIKGFSAEMDSVGGRITVDGFDGGTTSVKSAYWGDRSLRVEIDGVDAKLNIKKLTNG